MIRVCTFTALFFAATGTASAMDTTSFEKMMNDLASHTLRMGEGSGAVQALDYGKGARVLRLCSDGSCFILGKADGRARTPSVSWSQVERAAAAHFRKGYARPDVINTTKRGIPGYAMTVCRAGLKVAISPIQQKVETPLKDMLVVQMTALDAEGKTACKGKGGN